MTGAARAVAKDTLDWAVYTQQCVLLNTHTPNTLAGIKTALAEFKALPGWNPKLAVFCMEYTGIYNAHLLELLHQQKLAIWLESSLQIKQAGGMQPHRFLWIKQGLAHNFCHIFYLGERLRKPGESAARAAPLLRTAFKTSRIGGPIVCLPSPSLRT